MSPRQAEADDITPATRRGSLFRKYLVSFVAVVSVALITNSLFDAWFSYQEQKRLLIRVQHEQADAAAAKITQFLKEIEHQIGWVSQMQPRATTVEDVRINAIRLLRLTPAIAEVAQIDATGREQLRVSRQVRDVIGSQKDFSQNPAFLAAKASGVYYGPVYFFRETEPYLTLALRGPGSEPAVTVAEVNLRFMWDVVSQIKVGTAGQAFVIDAQGHLIAHPKPLLVLQDTDLSRLPHVRNALSNNASIADGAIVDDLSGRTVLSVSSSITPLGWRVFVELPINEAFATIYSSMASLALLLLAWLTCAFVAALLLSRRMAIPIKTLMLGAARIGRGDLDQKLTVRTGDELEALSEQFNQMAAQLRESYATLERKVDERTAELAQARDQAWAEHAAAESARKTAVLANETKSRFLAIVSHELRTPLNGVIGVLQLLDNGRLDDTQRRQLGTATASGDTLLALIDSILEYARLEAGTEVLDQRNFRLDQLICAAVDLMRPEAQAKALTLDLALPGDVAGVVHGDPVRLNRVLLNLLGNAIKFTERGRITLEAAFENDSILRISVSDTGIGVRAEMHERIFEDFVQADDSIVRRFGGTGLGLAISRRLARLMGGDLTVTSAPGEGATFRLSVPLAKATETTAPIALNAPTTPLAVLLVDDDPVNRDVGAALLHRLGHRPTVAADGEAAVALARSASFDAVLMDLHMPGIDGYEAARLIDTLSVSPKPRIIAVTADVSERSRERIASGAFCAVVSKPILLDALRRALSPDHGDAGPLAPPAHAHPADQSETARGLIDDAYLAGQADILGPERLRALRHVFAETAADLSLTIAQAARRGDHEAYRRAAHQLGSGASALGLGRLFARCTLIEATAASMSADELESAAAELETLRGMSLSALDERLRAPEMA
jgi:signal transduction histidine kinase/ActR/RegA family two-component response regulator/HPt (histidine-containing phosphotransfer) domain-containing protein